HFIWLKAGIAGDDTDGHIDNLARFTGPRNVVCAFEENKSDENYSALKSNHEILRRSRDQDGNLLDIVRMPMPPARYDRIRGQRRRLPESYLNFYIGNKIVLVPAFGSRTDQIAMDIFQSLFPDRGIAAVDCSDLVYGSGALHCISQQMPVALLT